MTTWLAAPLILLIRVYQLCISPLLPKMCRFTPTCSSYAIEALKRFGPFKGSFLAFWRICRCHPFTAGGHDPVPPPKPRTNDSRNDNLGNTNK